jgi:2-oxoglutarate ferredoxin oxidoreductase subunit beta
MDKYIEQALTRKGFTVVEALSPCPTSYGRMNKEGAGVDMLLYQKDNTVTLEKAANMPAEELQGKLIVGVFVDREQADYQEHYQEVVRKACAAAK